ncbi:MAG: hypothetical protein ACKVON_15350 [Beijerinckiaceae bacterium]
MTSLEKAEKSVAALSQAELNVFRQWFEEYEAKRFDESIERDAKAGKLDFLKREAIEEDDAGRTRPL